VAHHDGRGKSNVALAAEAAKLEVIIREQFHRKFPKLKEMQGKISSTTHQKTLELRAALLIQRCYRRVLARRRREHLRDAVVEVDECDAANLEEDNKAGYILVA
jgi:ribosomal protein S17